MPAEPHLTCIFTWFASRHFECYVTKLVPGPYQLFLPNQTTRTPSSFNPFTARVLDGVCKVTLTFESADQILWCDHSNECSLPVLTHGAICFSKFYKMKFANLLKICLWLHLAVKGLIWSQCPKKERKSSHLKTWGAYHLTQKSVRGVESIMVSDIPVYRRIATSVTVWIQKKGEFV